MAAHGPSEAELRERVLAWIWLYMECSAASSGAAFSRLTGIHTSSINDWKNRGRTPGIDALEKLHRAFGANTDDILKRRPDAADRIRVKKEIEMLAPLAAASDDAPARGRHKAAGGS